MKTNNNAVASANLMATNTLENEIYITLRSAVQNAALKYIENNNLNFERCKEIQNLAIPLINQMATNIARVGEGFADSINLNVFAVCEYNHQTNEMIYKMSKDDYTSELIECDIHTFAYHICNLCNFMYVYNNIV